jgi:hypothetical protein
MMNIRQYLIASQFTSDQLEQIIDAYETGLNDDGCFLYEVDPFYAVVDQYSQEYNIPVDMFNVLSEKLASEVYSVRHQQLMEKLAMNSKIPTIQDQDQCQSNPEHADISSFYFWGEIVKVPNGYNYIAIDGVFPRASYRVDYDVFAFHSKPTWNPRTKLWEADIECEYEGDWNGPINVEVSPEVRTRIRKQTKPKNSLVNLVRFEEGVSVSLEIKDVHNTSQ